MLTQEEDGAESRMDEYDYEYVDDDDATLELDDIAERLKRSPNHTVAHYHQHKLKISTPIIVIIIFL